MIIYRNTLRPVCISTNRISAIKKLLSDTDTDIVISDDGLQHYKMDRDIEIVVFDGNRGIGKWTLFTCWSITRAVKKNR